jgi:hypothetical protein
MTNRSEQLRERINRVRAVAEGGTINGTYKKLPIAALVAFREDLFALIEVSQSTQEGAEQ